MIEPILTIEEREAINAGRWFSTLSPTLRHDILRCAFVRRFQDGDLIAARGDPQAEELERVEELVSMIPNMEDMKASIDLNTRVTAELAIAMTR